MKFELEPDNRGASDDTLLDDLRGVARKLGEGCVTRKEYDEHGRWSADTLSDRFGLWETAIERAGLTISPLYHKRTTDDELFENLEHVWEVLGRQPKTHHFAKPLSRYSVFTYMRRFGSFRKALEAFVASFDNRETDHSKTMKETTVDTLLVASPKRHRTSRTISWRMRFLVMRRDDFKCRICGTSPALKPGTVLAVDHVVPWADGGETLTENLQTLCERCNGGKSDLPMNSD